MRSSSRTSRSWAVLPLRNSRALADWILKFPSYVLPFGFCSCMGFLNMQRMRPAFRGSDVTCFLGCTISAEALSKQQALTRLEKFLPKSGVIEPLERSCVLQFSRYFVQVPSPTCLDVLLWFSSTARPREFALAHLTRSQRESQASSRPRTGCESLIQTLLSKV